MDKLNRAGQPGLESGGHRFRQVEPNEIREIFEAFKGRSESIDQEISSESSLSRVAQIASGIPVARSDSEIIVDIGATAFWIPVYNRLLGYKHVTVICRPWGTFIEQFEKEKFFPNVNIKIVECDAERSNYPLPENYASCVVSFDLLEHLAGDPMNIYAEANRILTSGCALVIGTPNVMYYGNLMKAIRGYHPYTWSPFTSSYADRHNREYTPTEIEGLFSCAGFKTEMMTTFNNNPERTKLSLFKYGLAAVSKVVKGAPPIRLRKCNILAIGIKTGSVECRYPSFLYELRSNQQIDFGGLGSTRKVGMDKNGETLIVVKSFPEEIFPSMPITIVIRSVSDYPIDILADLFISGAWRAGNKIPAAVGAIESRISIAGGEWPERQEYAYISVKAVPSGRPWQENIIDIKLPYMRINNQRIPGITVGSTPAHQIL